MDADQVAELRVLLARARVKRLTPSERERYEAVCSTLEKSLSKAQLLLAPAGARPRNRFRVIRELDAELEFGQARHRARTTNFSAAGFCVRLAAKPVVGEPVAFTFWFAPHAKPIAGGAVCRACREADAGWEASFEFQDLAPEIVERLEIEAVDVALEMLWPSGRLGP
jgi:hypothetical protein